MSIKRISDEMEALLNQQITNEAFASQVFLAYGSWANKQRLAGVSNFFYSHATEEREHMKKLIDYIDTRGGEAKIDAVPAPPAAPSSLKECLEKTLQHEIDNSAAINKIVDLAFEERDWATFNFAQWLVKEQIEEEALVMDLMDKLHLATENNTSIYDWDKDMKSAPQHIDIP